MMAHHFRTVPHQPAHFVVRSRMAGRV